MAFELAAFFGRVVAPFRREHPLLHLVLEFGHSVRLAEAGWEPYTVGELRAAMRHAGTAGFVDGLAEWVSDPAGPDPKSPFTVLCRSTG